jgi:dual specificity tyrosine-phosphorylation-regulated kinase 2/3/4
LGLPYSTQIDMWSFGCLLCELSAGVPLFSGESEQDQFLSIMEVMNPPDKEMIHVFCLDYNISTIEIAKEKKIF